MKKNQVALFFVVCLFAACTKPNHKGVSAEHGCVMCHTTYSQGGQPSAKPHDTTICNVSDSVLSAYLSNGNQVWKYGVYAGDPVTVHTTCQ
jgi:hypothetical protein